MRKANKAIIAKNLAKISMILSQIRIVLARPSHPGNIGAAARAMKNMGFSTLYLVAPEEFPSDVASARASGADNVLQHARVCDHLRQAVEDCHCIITTTARKRSLKWESYDARSAALKVCKLDSEKKVAIVFGPERTGLSNEEIGLSQSLIHIPVDEAFSSMNLAAAVMLVCYEIRVANETPHPPKLSRKDISETSATAGQVDGFVSHFETVMAQAGFLNNKPSGRLLRRIRRLFNRAGMSEQDVNIMRGVLAAIQSKIKDS